MFRLSITVPFRMSSSSSSSSAKRVKQAGGEAAATTQPAALWSSTAVVEFGGGNKLGSGLTSAWGDRSVSDGGKNNLATTPSAGSGSTMAFANTISSSMFGMKSSGGFGALSAAASAAGGEGWLSEKKPEHSPRASSKNNNIGAMTTTTTAFGAKTPDQEHDDNNDEEEEEGNEEENDSQSISSEPPTITPQLGGESRFGADATTEERTTSPPPTIPSGEEEEMLAYQSRVTLFKMFREPTDTQARWKELGSGNFRLNVPKQGGLPRLVMRREGVLKLLLNGLVRQDTKFDKSSDKMVRFSLMESDSTSQLGIFLIKFPRADECDAFLAEVKARMEAAQSL